MLTNVHSHHRDLGEQPQRHDDDDHDDNDDNDDEDDDNDNEDDDDYTVKMSLRLLLMTTDRTRAVMDTFCNGGSLVIV